MLRSDLLRKCRKSVLYELSSLAKTAKRLQECQRGTLSPPDDEVNDMVDDMILKAFKIVLRGVRFIDVLEEDKRARAPAAVTVMATVMEESLVPPTPPADRLTSTDTSHESASEAGSRATTDATDMSIAASDSSEIAKAFPLPLNRRLSSLPSASPTPALHRLSQSRQPPTHHRMSSSISHRFSLAGPSPLSDPRKLVSERMNRSHDTFLSHLGSFIGRLPLQSQSRPELSFAIKQSAISGGELLAVVDGVCAHSNPYCEDLSYARNAMFERIYTLVLSARDTLANAATEDADVIMPEDGSVLLSSATGCVRAAGECVAKARTVIERVGDFEVELEDHVLDIDLSILDILVEDHATPEADHAVLSEASSQAQSDVAAEPEPEQPELCNDQTVDGLRDHNSSTPKPPKLDASVFEKPLPSVPELASPVSQQSFHNPSPAASRCSSPNDDNVSSMVSSVSSLRPSLPPLPKLATALLPPADSTSTDSAIEETEFHSSRFDSLVASSAGSSATYLSRDSETSIVSQVSTRASTPDHTLVPRNQPSMSELSAAASSVRTEEVDDVECRLMEKTYAHELMFNKEGQVTGGSLPALVERLTAYDSTPDQCFVSTFFLTFRLFCTPTKLAEALINRFEYVTESPHVAGPVRLRVYNVFKGWLESHWRHQSDAEALDMVVSFAEKELGSVLPSAGRRLVDLAHRVSGEGALVPRFVSCMGKTNTPIGQYIPAETPLPQPAISKNQHNLLHAFRAGGTMPSILDFEPIEIARQLTIKQMNIFCAILPEELLGSQWMKRRGVDAPKVKAMSSLSTDISNLVADTILQHPETKKRATVIKQWIKIAHQCLELHNYDGLMAINCSLTNTTISRLRKTWDLVSVKRKDMLRQLQETVESSQNNKVLRTRLHDHVPPCLPFLGMYLTDLTFVDIGNPATKQLSHGNQTEESGGGAGLTIVNFDKHARTAKIIGDLQRFQIPYRLTELPDMQDWISAQISRVRENDQGKIQVTYYRKSLLLEPREQGQGPRTPIEPPVPSIAGQGGSRTDLFGWVSRDRNTQRPTPTQV